MPIIAGFIVPHPPMIVPDVGKGSESKVETTIASYKAVAKEIAELCPDTVIVSSPHSVIYGDYFHISPGKGAKGSFARFGAANVTFDEDYDTEFVRDLSGICRICGFPAGTLGERDPSLDHGTMVPLYFIRQVYSSFRLVRIGLSGLPLTEHYKFGQYIRKAADCTDKRIVYIASGDLSHKLQSYGPYGFAPEGPEYDKRVMDVCSRGAFDELLEFDESFCEKAAECGHRSFVMMAGAFDGISVTPKFYSHEDVTGVGYGICSYYPQGADSDRKLLDVYLKRQTEKAEARKNSCDEYVKLAWKTIESYIRDGEVLGCPEGLPPEMYSEKAGAFVSIHKSGALRGCIGTIAPTKKCIAEEIISNAISASTRDTRFEPITADELPLLEINVDILGKPEKISTADELDVKRYGVIVSCGIRRGLLLPDIDGVDTVEEQISIAMRKGGISPEDRYTLERFEVVRHF